MFQFSEFLTLAQLNAAAPGGTNPAAPAPAPGAAPAAPAAPAAGAPVAPEATTVTTAPGSTTTSRPAEPPSLLGQFAPLLIMGLMVVALFYFTSRNQRKEEKRKKEMIANLRKGDRIVTIGGMMASVVSVDNDSVVLKIDEANNVKVTYRKSAILEVEERDEKK